MRAILLSLLLATSASADEMTPVGCNALGLSAGRAADRLEETITTMRTTAFRDAIPYMPESTQASANDVEDTRRMAEIFVNNYAKALRAFSEKIKNCGEQ